MKVEQEEKARMRHRHALAKVKLEKVSSAYLKDNSIPHRVNMHGLFSNTNSVFDVCGDSAG